MSMTSRRERPRVLFVGAFPPPGSGIYGGMVSACSALMGSSFTTRLEVLPLDTTQRSVPPPGLAVRLADALARSARFAWMLIRYRPDAAFLFVAPGLSFVEKGSLAVMARAFGARPVLAPRGGKLMEEWDRAGAFAAFGRFVLARCAAVVCQGPGWRRYLHARMGVPEERLPIIENWTAEPAILELGSARVPSSGAVELLFLAWLHAEKGIFELLEALAALRSRAPELAFYLTMAGDGHAAEEARAAVHALGLKDVVRFAGWVEGEEKRALLSRASVFVLPSWYEGFPNALVEAMSAGLAVVVTPVGVIGDVIEDGRNGLLVPPRDVAALSSALERVVRDGASRARMGAAAHADAASRFGVERAAEQLSVVLGGG